MNVQILYYSQKTQIYEKDTEILWNKYWKYCWFIYWYSIKKEIVVRGNCLANAIHREHYNYMLL